MTLRSVRAPTTARRLATEGAVSWYAATTGEGRPCVVLKATDASALEGAVHAHSVVSSDELPAVLSYDLDAETPWLAFDCDPIGTLDDLATQWPKRSLPYTQAIVVTQTLGRALAAAHDAGALFGALATSQVLVTRDGTLAVVGLGFGEAARGPQAYRSPIVALGEPPTPASDVYAALLLIRAHVAWVTGAPAPLVRILRGDPGPLERAFARLVFGVFNQTTPVDGRSGLRAVERFWSFASVSPDHEGFAERARSTLVGNGVRLTIARDGSWFAVDGGQRHDLLRREPARRVLWALISAGGAPLAVGQLVHNAWPGESLVGSSGADRLYVALSTLRKLDLRTAIVREPGGYALRASTTYRDA